MMDDHDFMQIDKNIKKILVVTPAPEKFKWIINSELERKYQFDFVNLCNVSSSSWKMVLDGLGVRGLKNYDIVISLDFYLTIGIQLKKFITHSLISHIAYSFNKSRASKIEELSLVRRFLTFLLRDCDLFVVNSSHEKKIFSNTYQIDRTKFIFRHWGADLPHFTPENIIREKYLINGRFICSIGRNNRDYKTLFESIQGTELKLVVVAPEYALSGLEIPKNVIHLQDVSTSDSIGILNASEVSVIPIRDSSRGAGHMTIVFGMHLGKLQIVTDVETISDYCPSDCILKVNKNDVLALKETILNCFNNSDSFEDYKKNSLHYAEKYLSTDATRKSIDALLESWPTRTK